MVMTKDKLRELVKKSTHKKRGAKTEFMLEIDGEEKPIREWAELFGLGYHTILYRYKQGKRGRELIQPPREKLNKFL